MRRNCVGHTLCAVCEVAGDEECVFRAFLHQLHAFCPARDYPVEGECSGFAIVELIGEKGYRVGNVDVTIIAQAPKLLPHIEQMRANVAADLGVAPDAVSVKATTTERLGFTGRKEGIAAQASALILTSHFAYGIQEIHPSGK